jgi:hypothetical protein
LQVAAGAAIDALAAAGAAELAAMRAVEIGGAAGPLAADVNGVYERTDEVKNGKPVFAKKVGGGSELDVGLWEAPDGYWYVTRGREIIDANKAGGIAATVCAGVAHPAVPGTAWKVYNCAKWNVQEAVTVRTLTAVEAVSCWQPLFASVGCRCSNILLVSCVVLLTRRAQFQLHRFLHCLLLFLNLTFAWCFKSRLFAPSIRPFCLTCECETVECNLYVCAVDLCECGGGGVGGSV